MSNLLTNQQVLLIIYLLIYQQVGGYMINRFESFTTYIIELYRSLQKIKDMEMRQFGLKAGHTMCLYYLGERKDGLTVTQLSELCREDKAAISRSISQLEKQGLVHTAREDAKRSYRSPVILTEKGEKLSAKLNERIDNALMNGGSGFSDAQRDALYFGLEQVLSNLTDYIDDINERFSNSNNNSKKERTDYERESL